MLKKTLTIVALLVLAATVAACGGETEPQAVVTVTATPTPTPTYTPTPTPDPTESFTSLERKNYIFIERNYEILSEVTDEFMGHADASDLSDMALMSLCTDACGDWIRISKKWNRIDWSYGETSQLEDHFDRYMNATNSYLRNWLNLLLGDGNFDQQCENIFKAEERIEKYGPRVERELERLAGDSI